MIVVYDGTKSPTQDNIKKVYEIKFGEDRLDDTKRKAYETIAGGAEFEVLTPEDCGEDPPSHRSREPTLRMRLGAEAYETADAPAQSSCLEPREGPLPI